MFTLLFFHHRQKSYRTKRDEPQALPVLYAVRNNLDLTSNTTVTWPRRSSHADNLHIYLPHPRGPRIHSRRTNIRTTSPLPTLLLHKHNLNPAIANPQPNRSDRCVSLEQRRKLTIEPVVLESTLRGRLRAARAQWERYLSRTAAGAD